MITWVVGGGGLLGSAIQRQCRQLFVPTPVPWADPAATASVFQRDASRFQSQAAEHPWAVVWAAGAATVAANTRSTERELDALKALLIGLRDHPPKGAGAVFLSSSAGGVYAGSADPPFSLSTAAVPLSPYGELKLAQEQAAKEVLDGLFPLIIGRFSNLYGPGQNMTKLQGIISRLALAAVTRQPINIFVPLDTIRDYVYVYDAAVAAWTFIMEAVDRQVPESQTILIASGQAVTIGQVIHTMNQVTKGRVPVAFSSHHSAVRQALDLRVSPSPGVVTPTPLPAGMRSTYLDVLQRMQASRT